MSESDKIKELNIRDLLNLSNSLNKSIKQLEQSRQQLIFDHHYELIVSSDKISGMKQSLEELTPTAEKLNEQLSKITKVEDLTKLKRVVLIEQIVSLPDKLQLLVDEGKLDAAISLYNQQRNNIEKLINAKIEGVSRINSKCMSIIKV